MSFQNFDVVIIGGGPGGYVAAIRAAQLNKKVAIVEKERLGGTCLNWGCIPTKALLKSAEKYQMMLHSEEFGISHKGLKVDWDKVVKQSRTVSTQISGGVEFLIKKNKITHFTGLAHLTSSSTVEVLDGKKKVADLKAGQVVIATGAKPRRIPGIEFDGKKIISSKEAMVLSPQPKSMIVMGGGAIGIEFAYFYNAFGTKVTLVEMMDQLLPLEDAEVSQTLARAFQKQGIEVLVKTKVESVKPTAKGVQVKVKGEKEQTIDADVALVAIGVQANVEGLGIEALGVEMEKGFIKVDDHFMTNVPGLYAIGDIAGPPWLAHVASHEGIVAIETMFGANESGHGVDYDNVPNCVYCQPQVASIGLNEKTAREKGYKVKVGKFPFQASGKAKAIGETTGFVKLVFDEEYGEFLGAQIIGCEATEMIAELGLAKALEATAEDLFRTMHAHPTLAESVMEAAGAAFNQAIHI